MEDMSAIKKLEIPFHTRRMLFEVPNGSVIVKADADNINPGFAAVWYNEPQAHPDFEGENYMKTWVFSVLSDDEPFPRTAKYVGSAIQHDRVWHVIDLAPDRR